MKSKKFLLTLSTALLAGLAVVGCAPTQGTSSQASSVESSSESVALVEQFCAAMENVSNFTIEYDDPYGTEEDEKAYSYKATADASFIDYGLTYEGYGYTDTGYILVANKGIYSIATDDYGDLYVANIFSKATNISLAEINGTPAFLSTLGDEVWKDTDEENVFTTTNGQAIAEICSLAGQSSASTFCESVKLTINKENPSEAKLTMHFDESGYYEDGTAYDYSITIKDVNTTTITGLDSLKATATKDTGLTGGWTDEQKEQITECAGCVLPANTFDYASYAWYTEKDATFDFMDLSCGNVSSTYGAELEKLGFVKNADNSYEGDDGVSNYYEKFIMSEDGKTYEGVYTVGVFYTPSESYSYYGELYPAFYANGTFQVEVTKTMYMQADELLTFFKTTPFNNCYIPAPTFTETPIKIVWEDQSNYGVYYGLTNWYVAEGTFSTHKVALDTLNTYIDALKKAGWTYGEGNDPTTLEENGYVALYYLTDPKDEASYILLVIYVDTTTETHTAGGGFKFDIEY